MMEHKHAALLRMAADNADQRFDCDDIENSRIANVVCYPQYNWRPVKTTKKIKRWLWADKDGFMHYVMSSESVAKYTTKLLWTETEFEVEE